MCIERAETVFEERVADDDVRLRVPPPMSSRAFGQFWRTEIFLTIRVNGLVELEVIEDLLDAVHRLGRHGDERHRGRRERGRLPEPREVEVERERRLAVDRDEGRGCRAVEELGRTLVVEDGLLAVRHLGRG